MGCRPHAGVMTAELPRECLRLLSLQDGVVAIGQALEAGMTIAHVRGEVRSGRWQIMHRGVYAAFNGSPSRRAELWGSLLRAGPEAVLSHETAAEVYGLIDKRSRLIHVTVPHESNPERCGPMAGVIIHRSRSLARTRHPALNPPRTRLDETVLDLVESARTMDEAYDWICRAIGRRLTTAVRLLTALRARPRFRWRQHIELALGYAEGGALSVLELRYARDVEHAHGIPPAQRQARIRQATGNRYLDNLYLEHSSCVEIDGSAAHPEDEQWRDKKRDRWNSVHEGIETIRIGVSDLWTQQAQCATAADIAKWLTGRGPAVGHPCARPDCTVQGLGVLIVK
jgi:hypothetical protein